MRVCAGSSTGTQGRLALNLLVFIGRSGRPSSKYLDWKVYLLMAGSALILAGIYFDNRWVMWGALVLLATAFSVRFLPESDPEADDASEHVSDGDGGDA